MDILYMVKYLKEQTIQEPTNICCTSTKRTRLIAEKRA